MIDVSQAYKDTLAAGLHNFNAYIEITLTNGLVLPPITNANLRSFSIDDAVSDDNKFTMLGSVIINQCTFTLDDMRDIYYEYDFFGADVVVYIDCLLLDGTTERIRKGTYFVETYRYLDGVIELTCYDNLAKFDKPYSLSTLDYPATIQSIVEDACSSCDVELSNTPIRNNDILISNGPLTEATTFRELLSWVGQIIGCYARCDTYGRLELNWCDVDVLNASYGSLDGGVFDSATPYESGNTADGGSFNPWNTGYVIASATFALQGESHNLYYNYSQEVAVIDTIITGISVSVEPTIITETQYKIGFTIQNGRLILQKTNDVSTSFAINSNGELIVTSSTAGDVFYINHVNTSTENNDSLNEAEGSLILETANDMELKDSDTEAQTFSVGQPGFVIAIAHNELLDADLGNLVANQLSNQLIGMRFRKATTYHMNDPTIEGGDIAVLWDRKNRSYPIIVTHTTFKIGGQQYSICGSETSANNSASRQTQTSQAYNQISTTVQTSINSITNKLEASPGLYSTIQTVNGTTVYYIHDKLTFETSSIIWRMTSQIVSISRDGGRTWTDGVSLRRRVGKATIDTNGSCKITFLNSSLYGYEVVPPNFNDPNIPMYSVFLQKYGQGDLWVEKVLSGYFTVAGTPGLSFCWEINW